MGRSLVVAVLALVGLLCAAGMGYAAYVVSRGSVAVPVTQLQQAPAQDLTPAKVPKKAAVRSRPIGKATTTRAATTTVDDRGGGSVSGHGGHGGDDD